QRFGARRGTAEMAARLQGDISGSTPCALAGLAQGMHFGVRLAGAYMPAFTDHLAVAHDYTTDSRVGVGRIQAPARQFQGTRHIQLIVHGLDGSRARRSISSRNSLRSWKRRETEAKRI